jgi:hypothetical protein
VSVAKSIGSTLTLALRFSAKVLELTAREQGLNPRVYHVVVHVHVISDIINIVT